MMRIILVCIFTVSLLAQPCIAEDQHDVLKESYLKQRAMIDQQIREHQSAQMGLMNDWEKALKRESYESSWDPLMNRRSRDVQSRQNRTDDKIDDIKTKIDDHKKEIDNLKMKREDLNLKVLEKYGAIPEWWKEDKPK